jgi:hypothetical protein
MTERRIKFNPYYRASMFWLSHKKRDDEIDRYLARGFNYQGMHRIFILQLDIIGVSRGLLQGRRCG